jgi:hypothetical protein
MIGTPAPLLLLLMLLPFAAISTSMVAISPSMVASSIITLLLRFLLSFFPSRSEVWCGGSVNGSRHTSTMSLIV